MTAKPKGRAAPAPATSGRAAAAPKSRPPAASAASAGGSGSSTARARAPASAPWSAGDGAAPDAETTAATAGAAGPKSPFAVLGYDVTLDDALCMVLAYDASRVTNYGEVRGRKETLCADYWHGYSPHVLSLISSCRCPGTRQSATSSPSGGRYRARVADGHRPPAAGL